MHNAKHQVSIVFKIGVKDIFDFKFPVKKIKKAFRKTENLFYLCQWPF